jgi:glycosyltransferase involved in cell wall biosynthesis
MKEKKPEISVLVTAYNEQAYIGRCLRSLLDQSIPKYMFEIIVINDASTDLTSYALNVFGESIRVINNKKNMALPASINRGIEAARGDYIVRVDGDDYVNAEFLNFLHSYLRFNEYVDAVACDYILVDDNEKVLSRANCDLEPIGCGIMFKRQHLIEVGMYDPAFKRHEDKELRIRFDRKYSVNRLELPLYRYRQHQNNITKDAVLMDKFMEQLQVKHGLK